MYPETKKGVTSDDAVTTMKKVIGFLKKNKSWIFNNIFLNIAAAFLALFLLFTIWNLYGRIMVLLGMWG